MRKTQMPLNGRAFIVTGNSLATSMPLYGACHVCHERAWKTTEEGGNQSQYAQEHSQSTVQQL
jgi:hypothetical protein